MLKKNIKKLIEDNLNTEENIWSAQKTKEYIELLTTGALLYQGTYNPTTNIPNLTTLPNGVKFGYVFIFSNAGTFYGEKVEIGDMIISNQDEPEDLSGWDILQTNLDPDTLGLEFFNGESELPLPHRKFLRVLEFLEIVDDLPNEELLLRLRTDKLAQFNSSDFTDVDGVFRLLLDENHLYFGGADGLAGQKTLTELFADATQEVSNDIFHVVDNKLELLVPTDEIIVGDALQRGRSATIGSALGALSIETGIRFKVGIDGKVAIDLPEGWIIRGNENGEGVAEKLIQGNNKARVTDESGVEQEVDLIRFLDLLTATGITANGVLNTLDLDGTARGVLGSWKITDFAIKNTTGNVVVIDVGTTPGGNDVLNGFSVGANFFDTVDILKSIFSETVEQALHISSPNWNSANLVIKISVKKIF